MLAPARAAVVAVLDSHGGVNAEVAWLAGVVGCGLNKRWLRCTRSRQRIRSTSGMLERLQVHSIAAAIDFQRSSIAFLV